MLSVVTVVADTAFAIAAVRAAERELFEDPFAEWFVEAGPHALDGTRRFLELPFFRDGIRLRTRFIDDAVRAAIGSGLRQLVLMGAGFDARGLRLPEIEAHGVKTFEVDFETQLENKRAILRAGGIELPDRIVYLAADFDAAAFEEELLASLSRHGFRCGDGAMFVWEGVTAYLGDDAIARTLRFMVRAGGTRTRVVFDYGFTWEAPNTAEERAERAGFTSCQTLGLDEVWRRYLPGAPHPNACAARVAVASIV